jgi:SNF2 family DNA or RNA helicase
MGLGKTLSMISAIVSSLPQATEYATAENRNFVSPAPGRRRRATLVIVTSMRKSSFLSLYLSPSLPCIDSYPFQRSSMFGKGKCPCKFYFTPHTIECLQTFSHVEPGTLKVCIFHGSSRPKSPEGVIDHDLVLTTYATLSADSNVLGVLQEIEWYRVVLDEGKSINLYWRKSLQLY